MLVRISTAFAFLALIVIVAGCGGGGSSSAGTSSGPPPASAELTKEAFIREATRCAVVTENRLGELLGQAVGAGEVELEAIRKLNSPRAGTSIVETMLDTAQQGNGSADEYAEALEAGETSRFADLARETEAFDNRARGMAEAYGLKVCGQTP